MARHARRARWPDPLLPSLVGYAELPLGLAGDLADDPAGRVGVLAGEPSEHLAELGHDAVADRRFLLGVVQVAVQFLAVSEILEQGVDQGGVQGAGREVGTDHEAGGLAGEPVGYLADVVPVPPT